jgi:glycosyltransferase involved in cell wall biosynthesis
MKIIFVAVKGIPIGGGIEKYTEEIGIRLVERGHEVIIYCSRHYGTKDGMYKGMRLVTLPSFNSRSLQKLSLAFFASIHQLFIRKVDIAHYHAIGPSVFCFMSRLIGRKTVVQSHGHEWMRAKWGWAGKTFFKVTEYAAMYFPHGVTAVSKELKKFYENRYHRDVAYIPTGITPTDKIEANKIKEFGLQGDDYILFAARHVAEKGAHYLIDAYQKLDTDLKLVVAGDAQHEQEYKALLREKANNNPNILFPGFVQGELLAELFSNALIYVLPSEIEGLPISLLEAMSYGNCCVVSDIPENQEALGECGYLFKNMDVDDLHRCLKELLVDESMLESKKVEAKKRVEADYTWDLITDEFESFYNKILK